MENIKNRILGEIHSSNIEKRALEKLIIQAQIDVNYPSERYFSGRLHAKLEEIKLLESLLKDE